MKNFNRSASAAALSIALLLTSRPALAQLPTDPVERAKVIAQIFQVNARQLTLFDREGKEVGQIGARDLYNQPVLSPDGKRVAVAKTDLDKETGDVWVLDASTGTGIQLTSSAKREGANSPVWSPDGKPGRVCRAARRIFRDLPEGLEWPKCRGASLQEQRSNDADRLVHGWAVPELLLDRPFRRRLVRVAARCDRRAETD